MADDQLLDMRYDQTMTDSSSAHDIVNGYSEYDLIEIFSKFGQERYPDKIASAIVKHR